MIRSLHLRLAAMVTLGALLIAGVTSAWLYRIEFRQSTQQSQTILRQLLETVSTSAEAAAYLSNEELARQIVDGLLVNDLVLAARLRTVDGMLVSGGEANEWLRVVDQTLRDPFDRETVVGHIEVSLNQGLIERLAQGAARQAILILCLFTLGVALIAQALIYLFLSRPLVRLADSTYQIVPGDGQRLSVGDAHRQDEFGRLVGDFNALLETVESKLSEERALRKRIEALEQQFRGIFEGSRAGIFLISGTGRLVTANPAFFRLVNREADSLTADDAPSVFDLFADRDRAARLVAATIESAASESADLKLLDDDAEGQERWVHLMCSPTRQESGDTIVEGVFYDISERYHREQQTRRMAEIDALTGLANRMAIETRIDRTIELAAASGLPFTLMFLDLDRFKHINDSYSHDAGDEVLRVVAQRLSDCVRETDVVARLGGDEFLLLMPGLGRDPKPVMRIADQIVEVIAADIDLGDGSRDHVGASIGVAIYPSHGSSLEDLRRSADTAMYAVKRAGRNGFALYSTDGEHEVKLQSQRVSGHS